MFSRTFITIILCCHIIDIPKTVSVSNQGIVLFVYILAIILLWGLQ